VNTIVILWGSMKVGEFLGRLNKCQISKKEIKLSYFDRLYFSYVLSVFKQYVNYHLSICIYLYVLSW
jgi:hypothetical protein